VTGTIPIVTTDAGDLVASGLAASGGRPGGNVTGLQVMQTEISGKHLSLLRELVPSLSRVGVLVGEAGFSEATASPTGPTASYIRGIRSDALSLDLQPQVVVVAKGDKFAAAFSAFKAQRTQAIVVYGSSLTFAFRKTVIALALKHQLPTICIDASWLDGFLMSYGWDHEINLRLAAEIVDRILRGAKAGDIPIQSSPLAGLVDGRRADRRGTAPPGVGRSAYAVRRRELARDVFYVTGAAHSIVGGSVWEPTPWRAVRRAAWG
jgi:putative tryptophan/tyrosine transport system substrate-binding protein